MKITHAPRARGDISDIYDWLSARSALAAKDVVAAIRSTTELVGEYPKIGRITKIDGVRVLPVVRHPYLV